MGKCSVKLKIFIENLPCEANTIAVHCLTIDAGNCCQKVFHMVFHCIESPPSVATIAIFFIQNVNNITKKQNTSKSIKKLK